jgi:hypothetical protein
VVIRGVQCSIVIETRLGPERTVKICARLSIPTSRSIKIAGLFIKAAFGKPKLTIALVLVVLVALAGTMTYTGFLVIGLLAEHLGTGRFVAGLLLGVLFARFPWISNGRLRVVGLLPKPVRRPFVVSLLAFCLLSFLWREAYVPAAFTGFAAAFLLAFPWLKKAVVERAMSSLFKSPLSPQARSRDDDNVIEGEFKERKE